MSHIDYNIYNRLDIAQYFCSYFVGESFYLSLVQDHLWEGFPLRFSWIVCDRILMSYMFFLISTFVKSKIMSQLILISSYSNSSRCPWILIFHLLYVTLWQDEWIFLGALFFSALLVEYIANMLPAPKSAKLTDFSLWEHNSLV